MEPLPSRIAKTYPPRGPLQQYRLEESIAFRCFRCGTSKKSRLITVMGNDWTKRLCNGCYGRLLSLYEVKAGQSSTDEKSEELAKILLATIDIDTQKQAEQLLRTSDKRSEQLSPEAVRFLATSEHVAAHLSTEPQLEWSPAIIGLCKAVEMEIITRIVMPLAVRTKGIDLSLDKNDRDLGRITTFCADPARKPPELGVFSHFLQTAIFSEKRRQSSPLLKIFFSLASMWIGSDWLLSPNGLLSSLSTLASSYRNRAAHIDELSSEEFSKCRDLVVGSDGMLWRIVIATSHHK